jgi:hypothetical protein
MWNSESVKANAVVKWVAWAVGVIVLGALGSGFWEIVLKPALVHASYGLMSLSSLGIESVRTGIYERIATGSTARAGLWGLALLTILMVTFFVLMFGALLVLMAKTRQQHDRLEWRAATRDGKTNAAEPHETAEQTLQAGRRSIKNNRWAAYGVGFMVFLTVGMLLVQLSREIYQTAAVMHFQQALKIASPYLSDTDRAIIESQFAQIHSKSEYVAIVDGLAKTASEHGQQVPTFTAW